MGDPPTRVLDLPIDEFSRFNAQFDWGTKVAEGSHIALQMPAKFNFQHSRAWECRESRSPSSRRD